MTAVSRAAFKCRIICDILVRVLGRAVGGRAVGGRAVGCPERTDRAALSASKVSVLPLRVAYDDLVA